jgi:DNA-3-methyladenine glycosylase II
VKGFDARFQEAILPLLRERVRKRRLKRTSSGQSIPMFPAMPRPTIRERRSTISAAPVRTYGSSYRRVLELGGRPVEVVATQESPSVPQIAVQLTGVDLDRETEAAAQAALHRLLGLETDLSPFYRPAADDPFLGPLANRFRRLKPPRLPSLFECLVNAIACQQLTLTIGIRLLNRLAGTYGTPVRDGGPRAFPRPAHLAGLSPEALRPLGFSRAKALSIVALAAAIETGTFDADAIESLDNEKAVAALMRLRGIGRWSAEYALLRGLGRLNVFPGDDVGARNNLAHRLQRKGPLDYAAVQAAVQPWQPFAGLVYFHLLLANLADQGVCSPNRLLDW